MTRYLTLVLMSAVMLTGGTVWAAPPATTQPADAAAAEESASWLLFLEKGLAGLSICIGAALIVFAGARGISNISGRAVESIARQPEAAGSIFTTTLLTAAMIEVGMLFGLVLALLGMLMLAG